MRVKRDQALEQGGLTAVFPRCELGVEFGELLAGVVDGVFEVFHRANSKPVQLLLEMVVHVALADGTTVLHVRPALRVA